MERDLKTKIKNWIENVGRLRAGYLLVSHGVHIDTAVKIMDGRYNSSPKAKLREQIEQAMK